jgi:large subunit ribosomal protein L25
VVITLEIDGRDNELALPRHVQRHPLKGNVEHVGLLLVLRDEKVVVAVQIVVVGDAVPEILVNIENPTVAVEA